jgi:hypothetical protein
MRRKRNSWDLMKRQSRVSQIANPAFMLDPKCISYDDDGKPSQRFVAEAYAALEQQLNDFLGIGPAELRKRFTESLNFSPEILDAIIAGNCDTNAAGLNPWIRLLMEPGGFGSDKALHAILSEVEFLTLRRAEWVKNNMKCLDTEWSKLGELSETEFEVFRQRGTRPSHWSPHGKLDVPKLDTMKRKQSNI